MNVNIRGVEVCYNNSHTSRSQLLQYIKAQQPKPFYYFHSGPTTVKLTFMSQLPPLGQVATSSTVLTPTLAPPP
jgi:hypothetical protein